MGSVVLVFFFLSNLYNVELELTILRSRVTCSTDWAPDIPKYWIIYSRTLNFMSVFPFFPVGLESASWFVGYWWPSWFSLLSLVQTWKNCSVSLTKTGSYSRYVCFQGLLWKGLTRNFDFPISCGCKKRWAVWFSFSKLRSLHFVRAKNIYIWWYFLSFLNVF